VLACELATSRLLYIARACELATSRLLYIARACELATFYILDCATGSGRPFQVSAHKKRALRPFRLTVSVSIIFDAQPHPRPLDHEKISRDTWNDGPPKLPVGHPVVVLHPFAMQCDLSALD
jgi:hypothetical protein